jgi:Uma2 family endonuclease
MAQAPSSVHEQSIPPLENGDMLTREEFERRWDLHPEIKKAELIDGQVYIEVTVSTRHSEPHGLMSTWAGSFVSARPALQFLPDSTVRLEGENDLQPDVLIRQRDGGSSLISSDWNVHGPPELCVEVAASSVAYDLFVKREAYRRAGVQEYLVWQVWDGRVDWWELRDGQYVSIEPDADGVIESRVFPGLRLHVPKLIEGDLAGVLAELQPRA